MPQVIRKSRVRYSAWSQLTIMPDFRSATRGIIRGNSAAKSRGEPPNKGLKRDPLGGARFSDAPSPCRGITQYR